jgi:hypothetical protein
MTIEIVHSIELVIWSLAASGVISKEQAASADAEFKKSAQPGMLYRDIVKSLKSKAEIMKQ